jgi:hypothetical protein
VRAFLRGRKAEKSRILSNARGVNAAIPTLPENAISDEPHVAAIPPSLPQAPPLVTVKAAGRGSFMGDRRLARGRVCVVDTSLKSDPQQGLLTLPSAELAVTEVGVGASAVVDIRARRGLKLVAPTLHPAPLVPAHRTPRAVALVTSPSHARPSDRERGLLLGPARLAAMRALPDVPPPPDGAPLLALELELGALDAEARCPDHSGLEPGPALRQVRCGLFTQARNHSSPSQLSSSGGPLYTRRPRCLGRESASPPLRTLHRRPATRGLRSAAGPIHGLRTRASGSLASPDCGWRGHRRPCLCS